MSLNFSMQLKSYSFWLGISSALLLLVQAIGEPLGLEINEEAYMSIINAVLGIFVVLGIISNPSSQKTTNTESGINTQNIHKEETTITTDTTTK